MSFEEQWKQKLESVPERILPWERQQLPSVSSNPSEEEVVSFLKVAQPLIERGRWWYFCMGAVRAWKAVWSEWSGRAAVLMCVVMIHQLYALWYLHILQLRADTVGVDVFEGEVRVLDVFVPWSKSETVEDLMLRHERSVELSFRAKTIPWAIDPHVGRYQKSNFLALFVPMSSSMAHQYRSSSQLQQLEFEIEQSLKIKNKVDDLKRRAQAIDWNLEINPPYLDEKKIDGLLDQVSTSEKLRPLALDYIQRAQSIGWDLKSSIESNPYSSKQLEQLRVQLEESETLHSTAQDLNRRAKDLSWSIHLKPPYITETVNEIERNISISEPNVAALRRLVEEASVLGWELEEHKKKHGLTPLYTDELIRSIDTRMEEMRRVRIRVEDALEEATKKYGWTPAVSIPFQESEVVAVEQSLKTMAELQGQVNNLRKRAKKVYGDVPSRYHLQIGIPYDQEQLDREDQRIMELEEIYPQAKQLMRKIRNKDVDPNRSTPYTNDDIRILNRCLGQLNAISSWNDIGDRCKCEYDTWSSSVQIECHRYEEGHPRAHKVVSTLKERNIKINLSHSFGFTDEQLKKAEGCVVGSKDFDSWSVRNGSSGCECEYDYSGFEKIECDRYSSEHPKVSSVVNSLRSMNVSTSLSSSLSEDEIEKLSRIATYVGRNNLGDYSSEYRYCQVTKYDWKLECQHKETGQTVNFSY